jgi:hypothetical protein
MPRRIATQHTLEIIKGNRAPNMFDFQAIADATQLGLIQGGIFFSGRCVHLNPSGSWELGVEKGQLPFFLLNNSDDLDVANDGGNPATEADAWSPGTPSGKMNAVCALGGFELASTEFIATDTYAPNDRLAAPITTGVPATMLTASGVLKKSTVNTFAEAVVGVVTRGRIPTSPKNAHGRDEIYFASVYLPQTGVL